MFQYYVDGATVDIPEIGPTEANSVNTFFGFNSNVLDLSLCKATLRFKLFDETYQTSKYVYNVYLDSVEPVVIDQNGVTVPNAYASVTPVSAYQCVYLANTDGTHITDVDIEFDCVVNDIGIVNKLLKFTFVDQRGIKFSYTIDGLALWFSYATQVNYPSFETPTHIDVFDLRGTCLSNGMPLLETENSPYELWYNGGDQGNSYIRTCTGLGAYYKTGMVALLNETADLNNTGLNVVGIKVHPFKEYNLDEIQRNFERKIEYIPDALLPTIVAVGITDTLAATPYYFEDMPMFSQAVDANGSWVFDKVYGKDSYVCLAVGVNSTTPFNVDTVINVDTLGLRMGGSTYNGLYLGGATSPTITTGELKAWRVNLTAAAIHSVIGSTGVFEFNLPWETYFLRSAYGSNIQSIPTLRINEIPNPNAFEWVIPTPDGISSQLLSHDFGKGIASSTRANVYTADVRLRVTSPDVNYVITGVEVTNLTLSPPQLTALSKTALAGDFTIVGDIPTVATTTATGVTFTPTKAALASLEELTLTVSYKPSMKILNVPTMASPATLTIAQQGAVNIRRLKLQVKGHLVGDTVSVNLGDPLILTGTI